MCPPFAPYTVRTLSCVYELHLGVIYVRYCGSVDNCLFGSIIDRVF